MVSTPAKLTVAPAIEEFATARDPIVLRLPSEWRLTDLALSQLADLNEIVPFERTSEGDLIISPPPDGESPSFGARIVDSDRGLDGGRRRAAISATQAAGSGSKTLMGPSILSAPSARCEIPDVSWMTQEQFDSLSTYERKHGLPSLCPALVVEIISPSETVASQRRRMDEWMRFGAQLGWLIDPLRELVWIYRADGSEPEAIERPETISGEDVLPDFTLDLRPVVGLAAPTRTSLP